VRLHNPTRVAPILHSGSVAQLSEHVPRKHSVPEQSLLAVQTCPMASKFTFCPAQGLAVPVAPAVPPLPAAALPPLDDPLWPPVAVLVPPVPPVPASPATH
jgi:hypothetical protein